MAGQDEIDGMRIHQSGARRLVGMHDGDDEIGARRARDGRELAGIVGPNTRSPGREALTVPS